MFGLALRKMAKNGQQCAGCSDIFPEGSACFHMVPNPFEHGFIANSYYLCEGCREYMRNDPERFKKGFIKGEIGNVRRQEDKT